MAKKRWLTIHFTDGTEMRFDFHGQDFDPISVGDVVDKVVTFSVTIVLLILSTRWWKVISWCSKWKA